MINMSIDTVEAGMRVGKAIYEEDGRLLAGKGLILNDYYIESLKKRGASQIYIHDEDTDDIVIPDNVSDMVRGSTIRDLKGLFGDLEGSINKEMKDTSMEAALGAVSSKQFVSTFGKNPAFQKLQDNVGKIVEELMGGDVTIGLNSIKTYDNYTFQHSIDVAIVSIMIARKIGLPTKRLREIGIGCLLHDMGKIFIPADIVNKPDKLTPKEYNLIKRHPEIGYELAKGVPSIGILAPHIALQHHEKQDGSGYPRGFKGNNRMNISMEPRMIHLYGSIAAVADIYDALSSDRPYRKALPPEKVITIMKDMNETHLNRSIQRIFFSITPVYPIGTIVRVLNGQHKNHLGIVCALNESDLERPIIRLIFNPVKKRINPIDINLQVDEEIKIESKII
ncbi:MAG: HD-GYP domain-containing protein [Candidatus Latescibacteria bacterium]|jgi:HD-GYP domain-containing protein (c-di-GMP phosphodiesterase class II)|nr:HD-GYP domain-containing protein [Candidatus Latescibacterota bacterium]